MTSPASPFLLHGSLAEGAPEANGRSWHELLQWSPVQAGGDTGSWVEMEAQHYPGWQARGSVGSGGS